MESTPEIDIQVYPDTDALVEAATDATARGLQTALSQKPRVAFCLTGGSTPKPVYQRLAAMDLEWDRIHLFWSDDRMVPQDHEESNAGMARRTLVEPAGIPESNVHAMRGDLSKHEAADDYETQLLEFFGEEPVAFDLLHLGMGDDAHVASLFPGTPQLDEAERWAVPSRAPASAAVRQRLTLTFPALDTAKRTLVMASGEGKREAFASVVTAYQQGALVPPPIARVRPDGPMVWMVDRALADGLG